MRLKGKIIKVNSLLDFQKEMMFELMNLYFDGIEKEIFYKDLFEKEWVVILEDRISGQIRGFSTQMLLENMVDGEPVKAIFSGDTIIHKDYWGETELMRVWGQFVFSLIRKYQGVKLYWFLISMGYRTYRFLPTFFKEFYPCYNKTIPEFEKRVLDAFAYQKYPSEYDTNSNIIRPKMKVFLKRRMAGIDARLLKNPHIKFFVEKNPGYIEGNELACIAELTEKNIKPIGYKIVSYDESLLLHL